jgi:hypothetical protein
MSMVKVADHGVPGVEHSGRRWLISGASVANIRERLEYHRLAESVKAIDAWNAELAERFAKAASVGTGKGKAKAEADPAAVKAYIAKTAVANMSVDELMALVAQKQAQVQADAIVASALVAAKAEGESAVAEAEAKAMAVAA